MPFATIESIEPIGLLPSRDIHVPIYNNFILGNNIVVHNSGKTTLASQVGKYIGSQVGKPFCEQGNPIEIVFSQEQLMNLIDTCPPHSIIQFDEAAMAALAQDAASAMQIALIKKFITIRKKQLFILFLIPSIFLLRKYFAIFRTRCLIHTTTPDGISRGYFKFYSYDTKRTLYIRGIKEFDQGCTKPDYEGTFVDTEGLIYDTKLYDDKKEEAIKSISQAQTDAKEAASKTQLKVLMQKNMMTLASWKFFRKFVMDKSKVEPKFKDFKAFLGKHFKSDMSEAALKKSINDAMIALAEQNAEDEKLEKGKELAKLA